MMIGSTVSVSASQTSIKQDEWQAIYDGYNIDSQQHGRNIAINSNYSVLLNAYTDGEPGIGTRLTTWKKVMDDRNQRWHFYYLDGPKYFLVPDSNRNVFVNVYRTSTSSTAELIARMDSYAGNYYEDAVMNQIVNNGRISLKVDARSGPAGTYNERYLKVSSTQTPVSDGNGTSYYCSFSPGISDPANYFYDTGSEINSIRPTLKTINELYK